MVFMHQNFGKILYMSITVCIYSSLNATLNDIYPELSDQKGYPYIGQMTIMISYFMEMLGSIYGEKFISLKRSGLGLFLSGLLPIITFLPALIMNQCTDQFGICSYHYIAIISIISFGLQGLGLGVFTLLQNCYQSACTNIESSEFLQGLSFTIIGAAFLAGNAYSLPLIGYLGRQNFFFVLAIVQFGINFMFLVLPEPKTRDTSKDQIRSSDFVGSLDVVLEMGSVQQSPQFGLGIYSISNSYGINSELQTTQTEFDNQNIPINNQISLSSNSKTLASEFVSHDKTVNNEYISQGGEIRASPNLLALAISNLESDLQTSPTLGINNQEEEALSITQSDPLKAILHYICQPAVMTLLPFFLLTGLVIGFQFGQFYEIIGKCLPHGLDQVTINQKTFTVFIYFGIGEIMSGPIIALLGSKVDQSFYLKLYTYLAGFTIFITILNFFVRSYGTICLISLLWGLVDNFGQTTSNMIISKQWVDNFSLFGIYLATQNFGVVLYQIFAIFFYGDLMIYGLGFIFVVQIVTTINVQIFVNKFYLKNTA